MTMYTERMQSISDVPPESDWRRQFPVERRIAQEGREA
jgi:hypothetical protein